MIICVVMGCLMKTGWQFFLADRVLSLVLCLVLCSTASAGVIHDRDASTNPVRVPGEIALRDTRVLQEIYGGIVVDQTITVNGHAFYQRFVAAWRDNELSSRYAISVHEKPSARWGSQLWVAYAQQRVYQIFLPSVRANLQVMSEQAARQAYQNVVDLEVQRLLFSEVDLGADEL